MARVNRFLCSAAVCFMALAPLTAFAASPSPSPGLDTVLAPAPSGYTQLTTASLHGEFTAHDWAVNASGASPQETETTLNRFGFVDGYGKEWSSASLRRGLVEAVMAFSGGSGAKKALDSAPAETIPSSQWPENQQSPSASGLGAIGIILPIVVVAAIIAAVVGLIRRRQRPPAMAMGTYAPPSMSSSGEVQMSPDGNFWWDGQAWKDAAHEAPPFAQRSSDGSLWWDGKTWRSVPQGQQPPAG